MNSRTKILHKGDLTEFSPDVHEDVRIQFGFRKPNSTTTSLPKSTNKWLLSIDKGLIMNGVFSLDLRKAFDTIDRKS